MEASEASQVEQWERICPANEADRRARGQEGPLVRNGDPLQYSCLESSKDRGAWWAVVTAGQRNELTSA